MQKIPSPVSSYLPKHLRFDAKVDQNEGLRETKKKVNNVIVLLSEATQLFSSEREKALTKIESAILKISEAFDIHSYEYKKLMAKALINKAILLPPEDRAHIVVLANNLDPTNDKFGTAI